MDLPSCLNLQNFVVPLVLLAVLVAGVRNYVARNYMRGMKVGDEAFFYHSSCKVPGIVGVVKVSGVTARGRGGEGVGGGVEAPKGMEVAGEGANWGGVGDFEEGRRSRYDRVGIEAQFPHAIHSLF